MEAVTIGTASLFRGDCMEALREMPDKAFSLAIVDPPYGIGVQSHRINSDRATAKWKNPNSQIYKTFNDDSAPSEEYFFELKRVTKNQIIWGANNFTNYLDPSTGWVIWDKVVNEKEHLSMCELAYTSFDKRAMKFEFLWAGFKKASPEVRIHPTQKPIKLYQWLLKHYAEEGDTILDTHAGSMSSVIACLDMGFHITAYERDEDYFREAVERVRRSQDQLKLAL